MMHYNDEMIEEFMKCKDDIKYFAEKFIAIHDKQIKLNDFQIGVIEDFKNERGLIFKVGERRSGKSTIAAIILLHQAIFTSHRTSVIVSPKIQMSIEMLSNINDMYDSIPAFLKVNNNMRVRNKTEIHLDNGSSIYAHGSNPDNLRGRTITLLYIEEAGLFTNLSKLMQNLYPMICSRYNARILALSYAHELESKIAENV